MKITIPPAALEAGAKHIYQNWHRDSADLLPPWELLAAEYRTRWLDQARAAFTAMVEAWPMKQHRAWDDVLGLGLILLLPLTENPDEQ